MANEIGKDVEHLPARKVCFFTRKNGKYIAENGEEVTTEMLMNHSHAVHDHSWSYIVLD